MSEQDKTQNTKQEVKSSELMPQEPAAAMKEPRKYAWLAIISILLTAIAWIAGSYSGIAAIAVSACAIVLGFLALKSRRNLIRNTAITAIIASAVLFVVVVAFFIVIYLGLKTI